MFRCENDTCGVLVPNRQPENHTVTEKRIKTYEKEIRKGRQKKVVGTETVTGWEIVKEIRVCPECFKELTGQEPRLVYTEEKKPRKRTGFNNTFPGHRPNKARKSR